MKLSHLLLVLVVLVAALGDVCQAQEKVLLSEIRELELSDHENTTHRRLPTPRPQLKCINGCDGKTLPTTVNCSNNGGMPITWTCTAHLVQARFDKWNVSCEGYDSPDDSYVLVGSCGLEYSLKSAIEWRKVVEMVFFIIMGVVVIGAVGLGCLATICEYEDSKMKANNALPSEVKEQNKPEVKPPTAKADKPVRTSAITAEPTRRESLPALYPLYEISCISIDHSSTSCHSYDTGCDSGYSYDTAIATTDVI